MIEFYTVSVDIMVASKTTDEIAGEFVGDEVESIGSNQHQVTVQLVAPNVGEAYRRSVEYVRATLALADVMGPSVLGAKVFGPLLDEPVLFD